MASGTCGSTPHFHPHPDGTVEHPFPSLPFLPQVCDHAQLPRPENHAKVLYCLGLLACLSPDQFISFVGSWLQADKEASRVASLSIFSGILAADLPEMQEKKCDMVQAMRGTLSDESIEVKKAVLHFSRTVLTVHGLEEWAWELVAYVFKQASSSSSQMSSTNLCSADAEEEHSIRATCVELLENVDVSVRGMSQASPGRRRSGS
ncbi:uncharacterized protein LOC132251498 [Alligator mississippiensis]|uniref:uncharacterized protein LOC132251498 n=1 Tax=Alligator mississippiensis TaxID=8496 RepID=UPI002877B79E|nr:uncharacterized protein LOC132251498 [Alligator mississippiensis]